MAIGKFKEVKASKGNKVNVYRKEMSGGCLPLGGFYGIGMAFVVVGIAFTSFMVFTGVDGLVKLVVLPQVAFAAWVVLYKFSQR